MHKCLTNHLSIITACLNKRNNKTYELSFTSRRWENQLEDSEDHVLVDLALRPDLGHVSHSGLGTVRPGALRPVLLSCLGSNEIWRLLVRHCHVLLQPFIALCHHHLLLLWHCHQTLFHLQKGDEQQQPSPQHCQAPSQAVNSKWFLRWESSFYRLLYV